MAAGRLVLGGADHGEVMCLHGTGAFRKAQLRGGLGIVAGEGDGDQVGVQTGGQLVEGHGHIDGTAGKGILVIADRGGAAGDGGAGGIHTGEHLDLQGAQRVISGLDGTGDIEGVALHMAVGIGGTGDLDVIVGLLVEGGVAGVDVAALTVGGRHLIEDVAAGVDIQTGGAVLGAVGSGLQRHGGVTGLGGPGLAEDAGIPVGGEQHTGGVEGTLVEVALHQLGTAHGEVVVHQKGRAGDGGGDGLGGGVVAGIVGGDGVGINALGQVAEGGGVVDVAVGQGILVVDRHILAAGDGIAAGALALVDVDGDLVQTVVGGGHSAVHDEYIAHGVIDGQAVAGDLDIRGVDTQILRPLGVEVAGLAVGGLHLIPHIAGGVGIQAGGHDLGTGGDGFQIGRGTAGLGVDHRVLRDLQLGVGGVVGTAVQRGVAGDLGRIAVEAVLLDDGGVVLIDHVTVVGAVTVDPHGVGELVHTVLGSVGGTVLPVVAGAVIGAVADCQIVRDPDLVFGTDRAHGELSREVFAGVHTHEVAFRRQHIHGCQTDLLGGGGAQGLLGGILIVEVDGIFVFLSLDIREEVVHILLYRGNGGGVGVIVYAHVQTGGFGVGVVGLEAGVLTVGGTGTEDDEVIAGALYPVEVQGASLPTGYVQTEGHIFAGTGHAAIIATLVAVGAAGDGAAGGGTAGIGAGIVRVQKLTGLQKGEELIVLVGGAGEIGDTVLGGDALVQFPVTVDADLGHTAVEGGGGGGAGGVILAAGTAGGAAAGVGGAVRGGRDGAGVAVDAVVAAVVGAQIRGRPPGALQLGRRLLGDLDGGQGAGAVIDQIRDQHHVAHVVGVQAVTDLQQGGVGGGGHADVSRDLRDGVGGLTVDAPAPGDEGGAVGGVIDRRGARIGGPGGIEHTARGVGGGDEVIDRHIVADVGTGVDRLTVGDTVAAAGLEQGVVVPAVDILLAGPQDVVHVVRTGHDVVLGRGGGMDRMRDLGRQETCQQDGTQEHDRGAFDEAELFHDVAWYGEERTIASFHKCWRGSSDILYPMISFCYG